MPTPSCQSSLTRSPLRPRKQKISPAFWFRQSPCWTVNANVFVPRRISVTPPAIQTRTTAGKAIIYPRERAAAVQIIRIHQRGHEQAPFVPQHDLDLDSRGDLMRRGVHLLRHLDRHERRAALGRELAIPILWPPDGQKRTADAMPPRGRRNLAMSPMTFLDHPDLVRVTPMCPPWHILGGQYLGLRCDRKVDYNVGFFISATAWSDGPRRRVTVDASPLA